MTEFVPVPSPLYISSRLMAAFDIPDVGTVHLHAARADIWGAPVFDAVITDSEGREIHADSELRGPASSRVDYRRAVGDYLSFLEVFAQAEPGGAGWDYFPGGLRAWAVANMDAIEYARSELEALALV